MGSAVLQLGSGGPTQGASQVIRSQGISAYIVSPCWCCSFSLSRSASVVKCKAYTILSAWVYLHNLGFATAAYSSYSLSAKIAMVCMMCRTCFQFYNIDFATSCPTQRAPHRSLELMEPRILIATDITRYNEANSGHERRDNERLKSPAWPISLAQRVVT